MLSPLSDIDQRRCTCAEDLFQAVYTPAGSVDLADECAFADRCDEEIPPCRQAVPALVEASDGHCVRCYLHSLQKEGVAE